MDNITHSLTGLALARSGLGRYSPHGTLLLILAANAPDIDIVMLARGPLPYFEWHRGYTHSLTCLPLLSFLPVLIVAAIYRQKLPWTKAWFICCIGVGSHLLMDWTNTYGIRMLLPVSSRWFYLDLNSLYDGWILAVLAFAALWPVFARLVTSEIGARPSPGRATALFALIFFVLFDCARALLHQRAIAQLEARLYNNALPMKIAAFPEPFNPFQWTGLVETADRYRLITVNTLGESDPHEAEVFFKPPRVEAFENAKRAERFQYFLYFARFAVWSETPFPLDGDTGLKIDLTDLRFGTPQAGSFHCVAIENSRNQVLRSWFTYGSGSTYQQDAK